MSIIIHDENKVFYQGLNFLFSANVKRMINVSTFKEVYDASYAWEWDVLISELLTREGDLEFSLMQLRQIHLKFPYMKIILLTEINDKPLLGVVRTMLPGVFILAKNEASEKIQQTVLTIKNNHEKFTIDMHSNSQLGKAGCLTPRELGMMKWFGAGISLTEIGKSFNLNPKTISHYRRSVYMKMKCKSEAQFARKLRYLGFSGQR